MRIHTHEEILRERPITAEDRERISEIKRAMEFQVRLHQLRERQTSVVFDDESVDLT